MEATVSAPWMCEMSKHSMRRGQFFERERVLQRLLDGLDAGLQHAEALVVGLLGVLADEVDERALFAALRGGDFDLVAGALASAARPERAVGEVDRHVDRCAGRKLWSR